VFSDREESFGFVVDTFDVVIIDVKLDIGCCGMGVIELLASASSNLTN